MKRRIKLNNKKSHFPLPLGEGRISTQGTSVRNSGEGKSFTKALSFAAACIKPPLLESQKQRLFLLGITEKYRKQDMSSFVISSQCNNCMAYQAKYKRKTATAK